ncbi:redoxin domain-containing protein [bacterium]|nr:redoxin domain-containing protein [bacterium]
MFQETDIHKAITQQNVWLNAERPVAAGDLAGRIILLDFWTFCCINCIHVIPDLKRLEEDFGDSLTVIGVHSAKFANERLKENISAAIARYGIEHIVVSDPNLRIWRSFSISSWPSFVLIGPDAKIAGYYSGERNYDALRRDIQILVENYADRLNRSPLPLALEIDKLPPSVLRFPGKIIHVNSFDSAPILFVSDSRRHRIVGMRLDGEIVLSVGRSGDPGYRDGRFEEAQFNTPQGLVYRDDVLFVADTENHLLRAIDLRQGEVKTVAGTGEQGYVGSFVNSHALSTALSSPWDISLYPSGDNIAIAMAGTHQIWVYHISGGTLDVLAGDGRESIDDGSYPGNSLSQPSGLSAHQGKLYFVDSETSSLRVLQDGKIKTLIGKGLFHSGHKDGDREAALMQHPLGVFASESGIYIADSYNHAIRRFDTATDRLETVLGDGKSGLLSEPNGLVLVDDMLFITDTNNHRIVSLEPASGRLSILNTH